MKWPHWLRRVRRKASAAESLTACPDCGKQMILIERTTMTGNDMRTYRCEPCGRDEIVNFGPALWQILHDARDKNAR